MNSIFQTKPAGQTQENLQLLVLYTDFPAGVRAKQLTDQITLLAGRKTFVQFWKLDSIPKIGPLKGIVARDAGAAGVLIIASSSPAQDDPVITSWLKLLSATKSQRPVRGLLVGVLGDEATNVSGLDELFSAMFLFACRAQLDFALLTATDKNMSGLERIVTHFKPLANRKAGDSNHLLPVVETRPEATASPLLHQPGEREAVAAF